MAVLDCSYSQRIHRIGKLYYYDDYGVSARARVHILTVDWFEG
jgi:hypothetical protein